jgi:hypothetical protein
MARVVTIDHRNHIVRELYNVVEPTDWEIDAKKSILETNDWDSKQVELVKFDGNKGTPAARFQVQQLPGCCAVMTLSYVQYHAKLSSFVEVTRIVEEAAKRAAFGSLMLTQVIGERYKAENYDWFPLVRDHGYEMSEPFLNGKSGNKVVYLSRIWDKRKR